MNTEQRLTFEAKHKVPDGVKWSADHQEYISTDFYHEDFVNEARKYNALWQGYQSALEDRQGEAVGWVLLQSDGKMVESTDGENAIVWRASPDDEGPINGYMVAYMDSHCPDKAPHRWQALFTSPQPAQLDQWNAAIEALRVFSVCADWITDDEHDDNWAKFSQQVKDYRAAKKALDDLLALRKGA